MAESFNWLCPHCRHHVTISEDRRSFSEHLLRIENASGPRMLRSVFIVCPNLSCRQITLTVILHAGEIHRITAAFTAHTNYLQRWPLIPASSARPWPEYVPAPIREDYEEACLIRDLSAKSAATLARRCLQGILRDFFKVKPGKLVHEIAALKEKIEPDLWDAIDGVRKVGNVGAHMEADINIIVDVDPNEAQLLIELVETLLEETYIRREERKKRLAAVAELAKGKEKERKAPNLPGS